MTKSYRVVETFRGWKDGSGWSYNITNYDDVVEYDELPNLDDLESYIKGGNQKPVQDSTADDVEVTWSFYEPDDDPETAEPIETLSAWINDTLAK